MLDACNNAACSASLRDLEVRLAKLEAAEANQKAAAADRRKVRVALTVAIVGALVSALVSALIQVLVRSSP